MSASTSSTSKPTLRRRGWSLTPMDMEPTPIATLTAAEAATDENAIAKTATRIRTTVTTPHMLAPQLLKHQEQPPPLPNTRHKQPNMPSTTPANLAVIPTLLMVAIRTMLLTTITTSSRLRLNNNLLHLQGATLHRRLLQQMVVRRPRHLPLLEDMQQYRHLPGYEQVWLYGQLMRSDQILCLLVQHQNAPLLAPIFMPCSTKAQRCASGKTCGLYGKKQGVRPTLVLDRQSITRRHNLKKLIGQ